MCKASGESQNKGCGGHAFCKLHLDIPPDKRNGNIILMLRTRRRNGSTTGNEKPAKCRLSFKKIPFCKSMIKWAPN
jgi:hypothetical protein